MDDRPCAEAKTIEDRTKDESNLPAAHQPFVLYRDLLDHPLIEVEIAALP